MPARLSVSLLAAMLVIGAGLAALASPARAEPVFPPGLRVGLEPPAGLMLSKRFPGFEDPDRQVAIAVLDLPGPAYDEIERSLFTNEQQNLTGIRRESFPFDSGIGFLISGQATVNGVVLHKWFLLASAYGKNLTTLISVEAPDAAYAVYTDAVVRKALASVTFRPPPIDEQFGQLPFKFNEMAGFRVMQVIPGNGVILTDGPADDMARQPFMIISIGPGGPSDPGERAKFAREILAAAPLRDIAVTMSDNMRIGGSQGLEIRAQAKALDGAPVAVVQWVRFGSGGFLRMIGVGRPDAWDALFTRFRAVRDGIVMK